MNQVGSKNYRKYGDKNKTQRAKEALDWITSLNNNEKYLEMIEQSISLSFYIERPFKFISDYSVSSMSNKFDTKVTLFNQDVIVCAKALKSRKEKEDVCVLDFASYKNPGGGFLKGSLSQEEVLCMNSGLYPILESFRVIYDERMTNEGLYGSDMIYCPRVPFIPNHIGKSFFIDVIAASAPNSRSIKDEKLIQSVLSERMSAVYATPSIIGGVENIILGAFGCGVFGNDVEFVAEYWKELIYNKYPGFYDTVCFAIFDNEQYKVFKKVFGDKLK